MSGLDAVDRELLGMADEDDSSSEEEIVNKEAVNDATTGHTDSDDDDAAIATAPTPKRKRIGRKKRNASEDEGEASEAGSPAGHDSDAEPLQGPAGGILYGYEGIYESAREKALIEEMPELEREEILAKRREEIDNRRLEQQLLQRRAADSKRKSAATEDEESQKKRKLPGGRTSTALENYKATRERKGQRQTLTVDDARKDRDPSEDVSKGEESDVEWDTGKDRADSQYDEPATHTDLYRAQAKRTLMADHAFQTGFNKAITGCYVRIAGAPLPGTRQPTYRVAKVESVRDSDDPDQSYYVTDSKGAKFKLGKMVTVSIGKKKQEFPTSNCSDTKISLNEYEEYKAALEDAGLPLPKKSALLKKNRDLLEMEAHQMTQQEVEERLQKTGIAGRKQKEIKVQILRRELVSARANQDGNAVMRLETELKELGVSATASPSLQREASAAKNEQERLAEFNRKARKENAENVKRAQLNEARRRDKLRAEAKAKAAKAKDGVDDAETNGANGHTSQTLECLLNGEYDNDEPETGKIDFRKYDAVWQFGTLSKNRNGKKSVFRRTFSRSEMIGALGIKIDTSGLGMDLD